MDIPALGEENLARNLVENDKKLMIELVRVGEREREREVWKLLKKVSWISQGLIKKKKKNLFTILDWSKISFDWSKQIEAHLKF